MQNGHGRESGGCVELGFSKKLFGAIIRGSRCLAGGLTWMLLYNNLLGVVTSHVTKMAATLFDTPWPKPPFVRKLHGSVFYTSEVIAD